MAQYLCSPVNLVKDVSEASPPTWTNLILFKIESGSLGKEGSWLSLLLRTNSYVLREAGSPGIHPLLLEKGFYYHLIWC